MLKDYIHTVDLSNFQKEEVKKFEKDLSYKYEGISCPICFNSNHKILFKNDRHKIKQKTVLCLNCSFIFSNPRMDYSSTKKFYKSDAYRFIYEKTGANNEKDIFFNTNKEIMNYKFQKPKKPDFTKYYRTLYLDFIYQQEIKFETVHDIGCGKGFKLLDFKHLKKEISGIDPSRIFHECHKKFKINSRVGFVDDLQGSYDLVLVSHVLEHLHNIDESIKQIEKITKKYLFIEVPGHINNLQSIQNAHNFYFSFNTLNYFVENNNFKLIKMNYAKDSEFILALYEKIEKKNNYSYDYKKERKLIKKIMLKYNLKYLVLKVLRFFNLEQYIRKTINKFR